ncbi:MAG: PAS domain-containing protein, partial [Nitrospinaceae bacterium]|nr:PAS domain-containing protein [Nitrospinaceae bacterium]NIR54969.1 PAS domain-containing protein [Nitrospinaceae bacterium]NIS85382.1 PAS domain-containing protein [Nitrospinaceae bacterium]NIT82209.1 PAS domain-containing protein [Nitrospinaceae bacterium]NIU44453.1 PAS domain-containing protein [Nitrospinaceae bacterium]
MVLLDLSLPDSSGFNTFQRTQNQAPMLPIIVLTGLIDDRLAARALLEGAQDYLVKVQTNPQILERSIRYAIERKRSQQALRESEERLRSLLDNAPTAIYLKDLEGRYLTANPQHETLVHRDKEALLGQTDHDIFEKGTADRLTANDREVLEHGKAMEFEEVLPREDGPHTYLSIKFPLYDSSGHPYAVCGISTDITHRKQMEANLRRTQAELMEAGKLAVLGQMAAGIGHELNQPLEAFQAYIDNIRILLKQNRIDEVEENIRVVSELVTRTGKIITRVKALAQKRSIQIKPVSLQKTIDYTLDFLLAKPRLEEVEIVKELPEREIFVQGDEVQLQQVFLNLISNAFHAMM